MTIFKKAFLAAALPFIMSSPDASAAALGSCPSIAGLTTTAVKHIGTIDGEDVFLDKEGNRVMPCSSEGSVKYFIMSGYKDGDKIYAGSNSMELNRSFYDSVIGVEFGKSAITYGEDHSPISDVYQFRKQYQVQKLTDGKMPEEALGSSFGLYHYLYVNPDWLDDMPRKYEKRTASEKHLLIKEHYNQLASRYSKVKMDTPEFLEKAAGTYNELIPGGSFVKLYTIDKDLLSQTTDEGEPLLSVENENIPVNVGNIDGFLFLLYKASLAEAEFKQAVPSFFLNALSGTEYTLDQKLSLIHKVATKHSILDGLAKEYAADKTAFIEERLDNNMNLLNKVGQAQYDKISLEEKVAYNKMLLQVNKKIYAEKYGDFSESISPEEYKTLNDDTKKLYRKERFGDKKGTYSKLSLEDLDNTTAK